jgi:hypothetical protein
VAMGGEHFGRTAKEIAAVKHAESARSRSKQVTALALGCSESRKDSAEVDEAVNKAEAIVNALNDSRKHRRSSRNAAAYNSARRRRSRRRSSFGQDLKK